MRFFFQYPPFLRSHFTTRASFLHVVATVCLSVLNPVGAFAQESGPTAQDAKTQEPKYIKVSEPDDGSSLSLQVSSRRFVRAGAGGNGPIIQLVGVVHIADRSYYQQLQDHLKEFDLVLFEGVKPGAAAALLEDADDAAKIKLTRSRQRLLAVMIERHRKQSGTYPESLEALKAMLPGSQARVFSTAMFDAWGKPFEYTRTDTQSDADPKQQDQAKPEDQAQKAEKAKRATFDLISLGSGTPQTLVKFSDQPPLTKAERAGTAGDGIQTKLADALGLSFQLTSMDYNQPTWRNSDMTLDQVQAKMAETGANADALFKLLDGSSLSGKIAGFILGIVKANPQLALMTKVMMIETLANADEVFEAQAQNSGMSSFMKVIVHDRNEAVFADLDKVLADEPHIKSIAIFYGAGHLKDMEARLVTNLGYTLDSHRWFTAITVDSSDQPAAASQIRSYRKMIQQMIEQNRGKPESIAP